MVNNACISEKNPNQCMKTRFWLQWKLVLIGVKLNLIIPIYSTNGQYAGKRKTWILKLRKHYILNY